MSKFNISIKVEDQWKRVYPGGKGFLWKPRLRKSFNDKQRVKAEAYAHAKGYRDVRVSEVVNSPLDLLERANSLGVTSQCPSAPGQHANGSYHYQSASWGLCRARDWGTSRNSVRKLEVAARQLRAGTKIGGVVPKFHGYEVKECFGPFNWYIKNGIVHEGAFPDHGDHLHTAF